MSSSERISLLLAMTDTHLIQQMVSKVRTRFPQITFEVFISEDGTRALADCQQKKPFLIVVSADLPGMDGESLIREIRKSDGALPIIYLKPAEREAPDSAEIVAQPIVDWTDFLTRVQTAIPDDLKVKFGLFQRDGLLYSKLTEFGKKYQNAAGSVGATAPIVTIPKFFDATTAGNTGSPLPQASSAPQIIYKELSPEHSRKALFVELSILVLLTLGTAFVHSSKWSGEDGWLSIRSALTALTIFSYFGFFLGRILNRFVLSK